jgi:hypothetical protein
MIKRLPVLFFCLLPGFLAAQTTYSIPDTTAVPIDTTVQQKDLIDIARKLIGKRSPRPVDDPKKKIYFSVLPVSPTDQGAGKALITSTTAAFYLGNRNSTNLSSISFAPYYNLKSRYGLPIHSNIWLSNNQWTIQGDTRFLVYPTNTWGLGGGQPESDKFLLNYKYVRFYQDALKQITPYFFAGLGYDLDYDIDLDASQTDAAAFARFTKYKFGTSLDKNPFSSGPTLNLLYDTRNNSLNPAPGWYGNIIYRYSGVAFGSNNNWQSLYIDLRKYVSITHSGPKNILALWTYYWTSLTPGTPYLNLPSIGMDPNQRSGRGIEQSRYRGQRLIYFESEYRRDITANGLLGFVLFANINSVTQPVTNRFVYWNPAGGTGLRLKFNKKSDTNVAIDYGFSKDYQSVRVNLGEAF